MLSLASDAFVHDSYLPSSVAIDWNEIIQERPHWESYPQELLFEIPHIHHFDLIGDRDYLLTDALSFDPQVVIRPTVDHCFTIVNSDEYFVDSTDQEYYPDG